MEITSNIEFKDMTITDLDSIKDSLYTVFDDFWSYNIFKSELENENSKYIMAIFDKEIIGFAGIWQVIDEAHITNIVVRKDFRKLGIGSLLLEKLINISKNLKSINSVTLEVNEDNIVAQKLYEKFNFKVLGKRKNYYNNKAAIIMTLFLNK